MPVFKDENKGTWYVMARYVDWTGERKQKCKRGFATKREAVLATVEKQQVKIAEIEKIQPKKSALTGKVSMTEAKYDTLQTAAKKYVTYKRKDIGLQKQVDQLTEQLSQAAFGATRMPPLFHVMPP